jgi:hypothetical protein
MERRGKSVTRGLKFGLPSMIRAIFVDGNCKMYFSSTFWAVFVDGMSDFVLPSMIRAVFMDGKTTRKLRCQCPPEGA